MLNLYLFTADDPRRARHTVPEGLVMKKSLIRGAGEGVFSTTFQKRGIRFGPYEGQIVDDPAVAFESGYDILNACTIFLMGWKNNETSQYFQACSSLLVCLKLFLKFRMFV